MQSFCQETEFALTDDVHNKLKKHNNHHHNNTRHNHGGGGGGAYPGASGTATTTAQGGGGGGGCITSAGGGGGPATAASHNSSTTTIATTHLHQQQQQELDQLSSATANFYGHSFSGASPTIPSSSASSPFPSTKGGGGGGGDSDRMVIAAEKRANVSSRAPGRVKFNSIDNESLKESGGGGGGGGSGGGGARERKSSSGVSPSKKLKKSSSGVASSSSSSKQQQQHHSHHSHNHQRSSHSGSSASSKSSEMAAVAPNSTATITSTTTIPSSGSVENWEKGSNVGYNIFAKLRDLYIELKAGSNPRKNTMNLLSTSYLLDKLLMRENLNTLILNLYPGNKGYSLAFQVMPFGASLAQTGGAQDGTSANMSGGSGSGTGGGGGSGSSSSNAGSSNRHRLQSGGAVPNTINSSNSPSSHPHQHHISSSSSSSSIINHSLNSPSSSTVVAGQSSQMTPSTATNTSAGSCATNCEQTLHETMRWPYEEEELLACIDNEELPLMFIDLFEKRCPQLFYSGCVILEVRDYRQSFPISTSCDKFHVLLRPTNQTLLADVQALTSEGEWSHEEKMALESQLILATAEPLCLDPSPQVGIRSINGQHSRRIFNSMPIRRHARKFSQVAINRKRKTDQFTHHFGLELFDFMSRHRQRPRLSMGASSSSNTNASGGGSAGGRVAELAAGPTTPTTSLSTSSSSSSFGAARVKRIEIQPVRAPSLSLPHSLTVPSGEVNVERFAKAFERPREKKDCMPQLVEEYVLETDRGNGRVNFIKLSILQRPSNSEYLGMLYLDRDYKADERNGEACQFSLGTRAHANRYIQQFTEIFTEEGRKKVKITHVVPGQQPRVTCTTGLWEHQQQQQQQQSQQPESRGTPQLGLGPGQASASATPGGGVGAGILTVGGLAGLEQANAAVQSAVASLGAQGQLLLAGKGASQLSFQVHPHQSQATGGNGGGVTKSMASQPPQQKPGTPNAAAATITLASPTTAAAPATVAQQQQQSQGMTAQLLGNSQIKLLSNLGSNQFIGFTTVAQQSVDGQAGGSSGVGSTATVGHHQLTTGHPPQQQQQQQQQPIQYAAIMNCDNSLLKNAISSGSQLGIRNGSLVLLQQKQPSAVSLVQTTTGGVASGSGTTQMHVTLPQGLTQAVGGRSIMQAGGVPVLQAQLVGVPITTQQSVQQQQQQQQSPVQTQQHAAVVMSPPPPQSPQVQLHGIASGGSGGGGGGGNTQQQQQQQPPPHHSMVQQTQSQLTTKQQNIHATNPAINALFSSILASANQFEQQQAAAAAAAAASVCTSPPGSNLPAGSKVIASSSSGNSTIINLLNSAPAAMTNKSSAVTPTPTPTTPGPGPPTLVNAFSGLVSPPPSSAASSSSQYGNSPATPVTGTMNVSLATPGGEMENTQQQQQQHHHQIHVQHISKPLTKQQMNRLLNGGNDSPGLSSPSPSEGSGPEQSQQHQSVRVTMSALASQLASPPAIMTNSIIQANKHMAAAAAAAAAAQGGAVKLSLQATGQGGAQTVYGLNGLHQGVTAGAIQQQQQQQSQLQATRLNSPGSDSNHSTASSFSLSMPTLNNLLAAGSGTLTREAIGGPASVGASSSNGGNSMPPSPSPVNVNVNKQQTAGNILTIHASPGGGGGAVAGVGMGGSGVPLTSGCLISNTTSNSSGIVGAGNAINNSVAAALNNNSMLIDRLTAMANSGGGGGGGSGSGLGNIQTTTGSHGMVVNSIASPASILQKMAVSQQQQQQQQFTMPAASPKSGGVASSGATVLQNIQLQGSSQVVSGSVSPQTNNSAATLMQAQPTGGTTTTLNLQGLNLASLQGAMATIPGLQNVQVQIPGLAHTISLSLSNNPGGSPSVNANSQQTAGLLVSVPVSSAGGQQMSGPGCGGQQTVVLTNSGGGQQLPFAQLVSSAAGLKGLAQQQQQQQGQKHLVATSVSGIGGGAVMTSSVAGPGIQLVGLQMQPGSRNITATVSANQTQQTATILNTTRLSCPQLVRTLSGGGPSSGTTLKLTQTGGLHVQGGNATTGGIFVNQSSSGLNSILMTPQQLQALQKQKQQQAAVAALVNSQQQQQQHQQQQHQHQQHQLQSQVAVVQQSQQSGAQGTTIVTKATTKHGK